MPVIVCAADQPTERLRQSRADNRVVIGAATAPVLVGGSAAGAVEDRGLGPWHLLHDHQPQRVAGHIHPIAQCIGAKQGRARIVTEDIDQCAGVDRIDMLGIERQPGAGEAVRDPAIDRAQAADRGEQPKHAPSGGLDQSAIGGR